MDSMTKKEAIARWQNPDFTAPLQPVLERVFGKANDAPVEGIELQGITVGAADPIVPDYAGLCQKMITNCDFSFSTFDQCLLSEARVSETRFAGAVFDYCGFKKSEVRSCDFTSVSLKGGWSDTLLEDCSFSESKLRERRQLRVQFLRTKFVRCDFSRAAMNGVEFRAASFEDCIFDGATFVFCDFRGAKFLGSRPSADQFGKDCTL